METRSATKQLELEQQLSALMGMMQQQQERQEELAATSQHRQEELTAKLAQQQEEQMERFLKEQRHQWEQVEFWQRAADERIGSIQEDLETTKETVGVRLKSAEETIGTLQQSQGEMAKELQKSLREEMRREVHTWISEASAGGARPSRMRATAAEFVPKFLPSATSPTDPTAEEEEAGGGELAERSGPDSSRTVSVHRPPPFDGRSTWDAYRAQFEMLAQINRWTETEKATYLAVSLRGSALTVLSNLPMDRRRSYEALVAALESRYGSAHQAELNRMKLRSRIWRREETLPELAEDIERLVRLAYPEAGLGMQEVLAKDQFVDSLVDEDMRLRIRQNRPASLRQALEAALELESYQLASKQRSKAVRETRLESNTRGNRFRPKRTLDGRGRTPGGTGVLERLQRCMDRALKECAAELSGTDPEAVIPHRGRGRRDASQWKARPTTCWSCGEQGHLRRECKKAPTKEATGDAAAPPGNGQ